MLPNIKRIFLAASWISVVFQFTQKNSIFQKHICVCWQNIHVPNDDRFENSHILNVLEVSERTQPDIGQVDQVEVDDDEVGRSQQVQLNIRAVLNCHEGRVATDIVKTIS